MGASCSTDVCGDERSQRHATRPEATVLPAETAARLASMADGFERRLRCLREASGVDEAVGLRVRVAALESGVNCSPEQQRINALLGALESEVSALRAKVALLEAAAVLREAAPAAAAPVAQQLAFQVKRHLEHVVRLRRGEALSWHWVMQKRGDIVDFHTAFAPLGDDERSARPLSPLPCPTRTESASGAHSAPCDGTLSFCFDTNFSLKTTKRLTLTLTRGAGGETPVQEQLEVEEQVVEQEQHQRANELREAPATPAAAWMVGVNTPSPPRVALRALR